MHQAVHAAGVHGGGQLAGQRHMGLFERSLGAVQDGHQVPHRVVSGPQAQQVFLPVHVGFEDGDPWQVLHRSGEGGGDPRVSRVETLSRYRRQDDDRILGEQWQASYGSPSESLAASAQRSWHGTLVLERELEPAADTGAGPTS